MEALVARSLVESRLGLGYFSFKAACCWSLGAALRYHKRIQRHNVPVCQDFINHMPNAKIPSSKIKLYRYISLDIWSRNRKRVVMDLVLRVSTSRSNNTRDHTDPQTATD